jgi:hypothetical protein
LEKFPARGAKCSTDQLASFEAFAPLSVRLSRAETGNKFQLRKKLHANCTNTIQEHYLPKLPLTAKLTFLRKIVISTTANSVGIEIAAIWADLRII